ncbi:hypothetical protein HK097_006915, partial [Rhizophlyctis rosea]
MPTTMVSRCRVEKFVMGGVNAMTFRVEGGAIVPPSGMSTAVSKGGKGVGLGVLAEDEEEESEESEDVDTTDILGRSGKSKEFATTRKEASNKLTELRLSTFEETQKAITAATSTPLHPYLSKQLSIFWNVWYPKPPDSLLISLQTPPPPSMGYALRRWTYLVDLASGGRSAMSA